MTDAVFQPFYKLVEQRTGIFLDKNKQYLVESRLAPISQAHQYPNVVDLISMLLRTPLGNIHNDVFEALTTHETMFFRDRGFFDTLAQDIVPAMIARANAHKTLRFCCAGVSTGQEAYSLAILLQEYFPALNDWDIYIQATDISNAVLEKARAGIYTTTEVERGLDAKYIGKYLVKVESQRYQIVPWLRSRINFLQNNLLEPQPQFPKFDLILLRNVLIYFVQKTKTEVLVQIKKQLQQPAGLLILGSTESIVGNPTFKGVRYGRICAYSHA